eukprot:11963-Chlamydomonas_euryale.AAC.2
MDSALALRVVPDGAYRGAGDIRFRCRMGSQVHVAALRMPRSRKSVLSRFMPGAHVADATARTARCEGRFRRGCRGQKGRGLRWVILQRDTCLEYDAPAQAPVRLPGFRH